jgi:hypothetical protein
LRLFATPFVQKKCWRRPLSSVSLNCHILVPRAHVCAHAPELNDIGGIAEASRQVLWEWHPISRRLCVVDGKNKIIHKYSKKVQNDLWLDAILGEAVNWPPLGTIRSINKTFRVSLVWRKPQSWSFLDVHNKNR